VIRRAVPSADLAAVVVVALCALILHRDGLFGGPTFYERDTQLFYYPLSVWVSEQLKAGQYPLWLPGIFTGYPILADGELGLLYLPQLLLMWLLPPEIALVWQRIVHAVLAGVFSMLFLRTLRLDPIPSLGGALVFTFGSFLTAQMHHENVVRSAVWLPAALACMERASCAVTRRRAVGWASVGALAVAHGALGLHVQPIMMLGLALGAYAVFRALTLRSVWPVLLGAAIGLGGLALASAQLLPLLEWGLLSFRRGGVAYEFASAFGLSPENLLTVIFPFFFRLPDAATWWMLWQQWEITLYVGIPTLALCVVGVVFARHAAIAYFVALGLLSLLIGMAHYAPMLNVHQLLWSVPGFSFLRAPGRFSYLVVFACAGLAALGLQVLSHRRPRMLIAVTGALPTVAVFAALLALLPVWRSQIADAASAYLTQRAQYALDPSAVTAGFQSSLELTNPKTAWSLALLLLTAIAFIVWLGLGVRRAEVGRGIFVGLLAIDLLVFAFDYHPRAPLASLVPPAPDGVAAGSRVVLHDAGSLPEVEPNQLLARGIGSVEGYSSLPSQRHVELYAETLARPGLFDLWSANFILEPGQPRDAVEVEGVRFRANHPLAAGFGGAPPIVFRPPADTGPVDGVRLVGTLGYAFNVPHGTPVALLNLDGPDGIVETLPIRAGVELAERAYDRPSLTGLVQHGKPTVALDFEEVTPEGEAYVAHLFLAHVPTSPRVIESVQVVWTDSRVLVQLYGLALQSQSGMRSLDLSHRSGLVRRSPTVIENVGALPRAYVLPRVQAFSPARHPSLTATQLVANRDVDLRTQVLVEGEPGLSAVPTTPGRQLLPAAVSDAGPNAVRVSATADVSSYLVVNDFYHRGWVAYVDGERTRVLIANALFRAVPIEAGQHTLELRFEPLSHIVGALISALTLIACVGLMLWGWLGRR
jgi:hypothetical protein